MIIQTAPKPDFFFLWLYAVLSNLPPSLETPFLIAPVLGIAGLLALPFYAGEGEKSWHKRPVAIIMLTSVAVAWGVLTHLGTFTPRSPKMNAWSGGPSIPVCYTHDASRSSGKELSFFSRSNAVTATRLQASAESVARLWIS